MKKLATTIILALYLAGCATGYQTKGFAGGFSSTQLDSNIFQVNFQGNGFTDRERTSDFTLLRSAEIALEHGFSHFIVTNSKDHVERSIYRTPTTTNTNVSLNSYGYGLYGNARSTTYGGQLYSISKPSSSNTIVCFKSKPKGFSFNAAFIQKSLRTKYKLNKVEENKKVKYQ